MDFSFWADKRSGRTAPEGEPSADGREPRTDQFDQKDDLPGDGHQGDGDGNNPFFKKHSRSLFRYFVFSIYLYNVNFANDWN